MKVTITSRSGKKIATLESLNPNKTIKEVQHELYLARSINPSRQRLTLQSEGDKPTVLVPEKKLSDYGLTSDCTLVFKDLGPQISWTTVFVLEYFGPLLVYPIFYIQPSLIYGEVNEPMCMVQHLAFYFFMFHYIKREYETLFVHRFGNGTMPLRNLFKNSSYYWGNALLCSYFINRPTYTPPCDIMVYTGAAMFITGEIGNFISHQTLRNLRKPGTKERNIPKGGLFGLVSCANYTYEIFGWIGFSLMVNSFAAWLFMFQGAFQMYFWAIAKHKRYIREFTGDNGTEKYPRNRKAIVPFIV